MNYKFRLFLIGFVAFAFTLNSLAQEVKPAADHTHPDIQWWQEAKFGMFIHWGVYSIPGRGEWLMYQEHVSIPEYANLADQFNPNDFNPKEWVARAKEAGMKYVVLTTRHHDGFCLFDSKVSEFTAPKTASRRDFVREFADACHAAGMRMGFYYSLMDWHFPGVLPLGVSVSDATMKLIADQAYAQVHELLSNYGKVDILWFDGCNPNDASRWRSQQILDMARKLQPEILINDRAALPGDFSTPENAVTAQSRPWESCFCMNRTWGYARYDRNYKPVHELLRLLASCASQKGNFLLNVSPDGNGTIPVEQVEILNNIGKWMKINGKAIYGAGPSPIIAANLGMATKVNDKVYLLIQRWPGSTVPLAWVGSKVKSACLLATGQYARIEQQGDRVWLHDLPSYPPELYLTVIELTFDGEPRPSVPAYQ